MTNLVNPMLARQSFGQLPVSLGQKNHLGAVDLLPHFQMLFSGATGATQ